jgi:hypothetical protein
MYQKNPSQQVVEILRVSQRSCGNRRVGRNPLLCCGDKISAPPTTTTTTTTTTLPPPPPVSDTKGSPCTSPDNLNGYCIRKFKQIQFISMKLNYQFYIF